MSQIEKFKEELLASGFFMGYKNLYNVGDNRYFWKTVTEKTAFAVNLKVMAGGTGVVCGFFSTAIFLMQDDWEYLKENGRYDNSVNLREFYFVEESSNGSEVRTAVKEMYDKYKDFSKDEILDAVKNKRKEFLSRFTDVLKPLGFRKKGNMWYKIVDEEFRTEFHLDKSSYVDTYNFDMSMIRQENDGRKRYITRYAETRKTDIFDSRFSASHWYDWQLEPFELAEEILKKYIDEFYLPLCDDPTGFWAENYKRR